MTPRELAETVEVALAVHLGPKYDAALAALETLVAELEQVKKDRDEFARLHMKALKYVEQVKKEREESVAGELDEARKRGRAEAERERLAEALRFYADQGGRIARAALASMEGDK